MYAYVQPLVKDESHKSFEKEYLRVKMFCLAC